MGSNKSLRKKGDMNVPNNFRGFCLQPVLSKVFTSVLNKRLKQWSIHHNVLVKNKQNFVTPTLQ